MVITVSVRHRHAEQKRSRQDLGTVRVAGRGADDDPAGQQPGASLGITGGGRGQLWSQQGKSPSAGCPQSGPKGHIGQAAHRGQPRPLLHSGQRGELRLMSLKSPDPKSEKRASLLQPKATALSAPSHGTKNEQGLHPNRPRPNGPTHLAEAPPSSQCGGLSVPAGSPSGFREAAPDSRRQGPEHRGALSPGHKAELGCWAAPAGLTASPTRGSLGARRWGGALRREGRWRPEEPACLP